MRLMERIQAWEAFNSGPSDPAAELTPREYRCVLAYMRGKAARQQEDARKAKARGGPGRYSRRR